MEHHWVAVTFCQGETRVLTSFLILRAWSRRKALKKLKEELPNNPEYLDSEGELRPFHLIELKQIHPSEELFYRGAFIEMVESVFSGQQLSEVGLSA